MKLQIASENGSAIVDVNGFGEENENQNEEDTNLQ